MDDADHESLVHPFENYGRTLCSCGLPASARGNRGEVGTRTRPHKHSFLKGASPSWTQKLAAGRPRRAAVAVLHTLAGNSKKCRSQSRGSDSKSLSLCRRAICILGRSTGPATLLNLPPCNVDLLGYNSALAS